jgi:hypothetical protein
MCVWLCVFIFEDKQIYRYRYRSSYRYLSTYIYIYILVVAVVAAVILWGGGHVGFQGG